MQLFLEAEAVPVAILTDTLYHALPTLGVPTTLALPFRPMPVAREEVAACSHYLTIFAPSLHQFSTAGVTRQRLLDHAIKSNVSVFVVWAYGNNTPIPRWLERRAEKPDGPWVVKLPTPDDIGTVLQMASDWLDLHPPRWSPTWHLAQTQREHLYAEAKLSRIIVARGEAVHELDACIETYPTYAEAYAQRAQIRRRENNTPEERAACLADYTRAIELRPDVARYYAARATLQPEAAATLADMDRALALAPQNAAYYALRGATHARKENYAAALADYTHALKLRPTHPGHRERRAEQAVKLRDYRRALYDMAYLVVFGSRNLKPHYLHQTANILYQACHREAAIITLHSAYDFYEANISGIRRSFVKRVAALFLVLGEPEAALSCRTQHIERVRQRQPRRAYRAILERGDFHRELGDLSAAFADYEAALEEVQQQNQSMRLTGNVYRHRGRVHIRLRDWSAALVDLNRAEQQYSRPDRLTHQWRALVRARLGDYDGAKADAEIALEKRPRTRSLQFLLAWLEHQSA